MRNAIEPRLITFSCLNWRMLMWMIFGANKTPQHANTANETKKFIEGHFW